MRPFGAADWHAVDAILPDPVNTEHMHFSTWTEQKRRDWFEWCLANKDRADTDVLSWAITLRDDGTVIGWFGIGGSASGPEGERSFGYLLDRAWWNRGYMTEAL